MATLLLAAIGGAYPDTFAYIVTGCNRSVIRLNVGSSGSCHTCRKIDGATKVIVQAVARTSTDSRGNLFYDLRLVDSNPDNWVNQCAAEYYGVDSIVAE